MENSDILTEEEIKAKVAELPDNAENVYFVWKDKDGNYRGFCYKFGKLVQARDVGPETVLQLLLTHPGN